MANAGGMAAMHVWNIFDEVVLIDASETQNLAESFFTVPFGVVSAGGWDDGFLTYGFTLL